jgi:hypothetical protein
VPFRMSTSGLAAGVFALVFGAGDAVDGVAAGAVVAAGGGVTAADVAGEATGGADVDASAGDEAGDDEAGDDEADGVDPLGVALGET